MSFLQTPSPVDVAETLDTKGLLELTPAVRGQDLVRPGQDLVRPGQEDLRVVNPVRCDDSIPIALFRPDTLAHHTEILTVTTYQGKAQLLSSPRASPASVRHLKIVT